MTTVDSQYPSQIYTLWTTLDKEVTWLHGRWIIYRQLFGTSKERVELLNESAGTFFNVLQDVLLHDVQLSLSKLGDPADTGSRENMTLEALHEDVIPRMLEESEFVGFSLSLSELSKATGSAKA